MTLKRSYAVMLGVGLLLLITAIVYLADRRSSSSVQTSSAAANPLEFVSVRTSSGTLWVARYETTVSQWLHCVSDGQCDSIATIPGQNDHPITGINWQDAVDFVNWYRQTHDTPVRLPTREEWLQFADDDKPAPKKKLFEDPRMAWAADYDLTAVPQSQLTEISGSFGSNKHDIHDLRGNVWEWTDSCQLEIDPLLKKQHGCITGRYAMGEHTAVLSDLLRTPGNAGCGGSQPPANIGLRLVWSNQ